MKMKFTEDETKILIIALNELRNRLISEGRYTDAVDELIILVPTSSFIIDIYLAFSISLLLQISQRTISNGRDVEQRIVGW